MGRCACCAAAACIAAAAAAGPDWLLVPGWLLVHGVDAVPGCPVIESAAPSVVVVGSINEDVILRLGRPARPGETVTAESVDRAPGGKGANQAVAAASAGADVSILGAVGSDQAGTRMLEDLRRHGVRTELVQTLDNVSTGAAYITVTPDGENTIVLDPGANARVDVSMVDAARSVLSSAKVMVSLLEISLEAAVAAVRLAVDAGVRPVLTLAPAQPVPQELLLGLNPLLVNEHEAAFLLGMDRLSDHAQAAQELVSLGPVSAVVTIGAAGAAVADHGGSRLLPAVLVEDVVDTTGAGDAFAGALAAALARRCELDDAVRAALRAGAQAVTRKGAR